MFQPPLSVLPVKFCDSFSVIVHEMKSHCCLGIQVSHTPIAMKSSALSCRAVIKSALVDFFISRVAKNLLRGAPEVTLCLFKCRVVI